MLKKIQSNLNILLKEYDKYDTTNPTRDEIVLSDLIKNLEQENLEIKQRLEVERQAYLNVSQESNKLNNKKTSATPSVTPVVFGNNESTNLFDNQKSFTPTNDQFLNSSDSNLEDPFQKFDPFNNFNNGIGQTEIDPFKQASAASDPFQSNKTDPFNNSFDPFSASKPLENASVAALVSK